MFLCYKGRISISIIVLILDGIIVYYMPSFFNHLTLFYPMLTISLIPFLYYNSIPKYYKYCFILGIIYDLLYSNIFLFNALLFLLLGKIDIKVMRVLKNNLLIYTILVIMNIIIYDLICIILVVFTNYQEVTFVDFLYKIKSSLILNILSCFVYYFLSRRSIFLHKI